MPLDFPSSPTNGQVYGNYYYNSARGAWNALLPAATPNFFTNATLNTSTLVDATATASVTSKTPLIVKGLSGQTANLQEWQDSTGNVITKITSGGDFVTNNRATVGATSAFGNTWLSVQSRFAAEVGLVVRGQASQTGNLQEWQNSSGTVLAKVEPSGNISGKGIIAYDYSQSIAGTAATVPSVVRGAASQTADLQQWQSSTGAVLSEINSAGELQVPRIGVGATMPTTTMLQSTASAVGNVPIVAQGAASQTANLQEWQSSAGTVLSSVDSSGAINADTARFTNLYLNRQNSASEGGQINFRRSIDNADYWFIDTYGSTSTPFLRFINGSQTSMQIDSSGRVLKPLQPAFYARGAETSGTLSNGGDVPFNNAEVNIGSHFNTSTYRFTAPVAGIYQINTSLFNVGGTGRVSIKVNGASKYNSQNNWDTQWAWAGTIYLNANDYVTVGDWQSLAGASIYYGHSSFSGFLVG